MLVKADQPRHFGGVGARFAMSGHACKNSGAQAALASPQRFSTPPWHMHVSRQQDQHRTCETPGGLVTIFLHAASHQCSTSTMGSGSGDGCGVGATTGTGVTAEGASRARAGRATMASTSPANSRRPMAYVFMRRRYRACPSRVQASGQACTSPSGRQSGPSVTSCAPVSCARLRHRHGSARVNAWPPERARILPG